ncbi:MAG: NUDIX domain-containing protein [Candidatus Binatia bacterium]
MTEHEVDVESLLREFAELPRRPDGRIDYSHSDKAPVVTCFVKYGDRILLLKRSDEVRAYRRKWCTVAGYIDEPKPVRAKALEELDEELGISEADVTSMVIGDAYEFVDPEARKTWIVHPVLVQVNRQPQIHLDWEHTELNWILPDEISSYETVPKLEESLRRVLSSESDI